LQYILVQILNCRDSVAYYDTQLGIEALGLFYRSVSNLF